MRRKIKVKSARSKSSYFAQQIHKAISGLGTKDEDLIRLLATKLEVGFHN